MCLTLVKSTEGGVICRKGSVWQSLKGGCSVYIKLFQKLIGKEL